MQKSYVRILQNDKVQDYAKMKIWMVAREYAGIAEAGGVKNVVCSLSEELSKTGNEVTFFIPEYACTDFSNIKNYKQIENASVTIEVAETYNDVSFASGICNGVNIVFVQCRIYKEKNNVYTYNKKDLEKNPDCIIGTGYKDWLFLDVLFQKAVCAYAEKLSQVPDVVHCHDACTAILPAFAKVLYPNVFDRTSFVVSIHNAGPAYHHEFSDIKQAELFTRLPNDILASALNQKRIEPYLLASHYAKLSTVSYDYAKELLDSNNKNTDGLSQIFSSRKIQIEGITNGIDINRYLPENRIVSLLPFEFSPSRKELDGKYKCRSWFLENYAWQGNSKITVNGTDIIQSGYLTRDESNENVYISFHGRLVRQKGIFVILDLFDKVISRFDNVRFIINGQGETFLQEEVSRRAAYYFGKIVYLCGYEKSLARLCTACGDFALFPSEFEPCGLEDFIAQIYGTIPVAHATGGLKKIINGKTGFLYSPNNAETLFALLEKLIKNKLKFPGYYDELIKNAADYVKENYTWKTVANEKYIPLYKK